MALITELKQPVLTSVVENRKRPLTFLKSVLWPNDRPIETETVQIETVSRGRKIAPFVLKNGEAILVGGRSASGYNVEAPNIRIKQVLQPSDYMYNRSPGQTLFNPAAGSVGTRFRQELARQLAEMDDDIVNAEEYLCSMALQGVITYSQQDESVFRIDFSKPAANNITLSTFWDDATQANVRILTNFDTAKRVVGDDGSPAITDCILGSEAHDQIIEAAQLAEANSPLKQLLNVNSGITSGAVLDFIRQYDDTGVIFVGRLAGINIWAYRGTADLNGTTVNMVRPKYAEFFSRSNQSRRVMYYAAIPDVKALKGRNYVGRRFSKSWEQEDPSANLALVHSRPLPVPERPGATVSMKVISDS